MYKSASGCMEHLNIFLVSNINSTLKNLREKIFGFMVLIIKEIKTLPQLIGKEIIYYYSDPKDLE